eukprot:CAMPEP_0202691496 /NCGR_PEP_ID=MMETSP1385-20130828/6196_1 /ASSEMBLY_ACC=CAM_ASM_000861 /TAXON_ID=933848 /ORGANISM="Elphidium margaritaceum" /LENGTH=348 /DNA_ID=CAMNT_0049346913 /DNA_START=31 /DNA_END=1077 /DNA_ORIENTATION=-
MAFFLFLILAADCIAAKYFNEIKIRDDAVHNYFQLPLPHTYVEASDLPASFTWGDVNGVSYLTHSLNQHLPQYCGSCWAHGALSSMADRIKIARKAQGDDINLSVQFILNCGTETAGSCYGGSHVGTWEFINQTGYVPYDTCMQYIACSSDSKEGFCPHVDTTCNKANTCRTCDTFAGDGGACTQIDYFPNATVAEWGQISFDKDDMALTTQQIKSEIFVRGPVAACINAEPILDYVGGIFTNDSFPAGTNHIVSIVGWGTDPDSQTEYWIIRNSWGQYWGELGYLRVETAKNLLGIESAVAWVTPRSYSVSNFPCFEDGKNCVKQERYVDPSTDVQEVQRRLLELKQ